MYIMKNLGGGWYFNVPYHLCYHLYNRKSWRHLSISSSWQGYWKLRHKYVNEKEGELAVNKQELKNWCLNVHVCTHVRVHMHAHTEFDTFDRSCKITSCSGSSKECWHMEESQRWKQNVFFTVNAEYLEEEWASGRVLALQAGIEMSVRS